MRGIAFVIFLLDLLTLHIYGCSYEMGEGGVLRLYFRIYTVNPTLASVMRKKMK